MSTVRPRCAKPLGSGCQHATTAGGANGCDLPRRTAAGCHVLLRVQPHVSWATSHDDSEAVHPVERHSDVLELSFIATFGPARPFAFE